MFVSRRPDGSPFVESLLPRTSSLYRADRSNPEARRPVLANLGLGVVVATVREPAWLPGWVERYLVALRAASIDSLLVLQKIDLFADPERELATWIEPYRAQGIPVVLASARLGIGIDRLRFHLQGRLAALLGRSGVGKSSLLERLVPGARVRIGALSSATGSGQHTTTRSELFRSEEGLELIDTPGIRSLDLAHLQTVEVARHFPDFAALDARCRFRDCLHRVEPGCAIQQALENGSLARDRFEIYLRLLESL